MGPGGIPGDPQKAAVGHVAHSPLKLCPITAFLKFQSSPLKRNLLILREKHGTVRAALPEDGLFESPKEGAV